MYENVLLFYDLDRIPGLQLGPLQFSFGTHHLIPDFRWQQTLFTWLLKKWNLIKNDNSECIQATVPLKDLPFPAIFSKTTAYHHITCILKWHLACLWIWYHSLVTSCAGLRELEPQTAYPMSFTWASHIAASALTGCSTLPNQSNLAS